MATLYVSRGDQHFTSQVEIYALTVSPTPCHLISLWPACRLHIVAIRHHCSSLRVTDVDVHHMTPCCQLPVPAASTLPYVKPTTTRGRLASDVKSVVLMRNKKPWLSFTRRRCVRECRLEARFSPIIRSIVKNTLTRHHRQF